MLHLPVLRAGRPYRSLTTYQLTHLGTGEPVAEVSQANSGLIARDLGAAAQNQKALAALTVRELIEIAGRAGHYLTDEELPIGDGTQTADEFLAAQSATTGLPQSLGRRNLAKVKFVLSEMERVLGGLTRGLDPEVLDRGWGVQETRALSFRREADALGAILPSNSPGVHSLWLPAIPLKVSLALKPGRQEPWTPFRVAQAFIAAGCPAEAFSVYPADHAGATEILLRCGRSLLYGDQKTVQPWVPDPRVQIHGPGWSKVMVGPDLGDGWRDRIDLMEASVADNGGRSCINASGVWTTAQGEELAYELARRLVQIEALPLDHPEARLAAFPSADAAQAMSDYIDARLDSGARDLTAELRGGGRVAEAGGCHFVLPTVVYCDDPDHPLARAEFLFPYAAVVEVERDDLVGSMGSSLVVSALTEDDELIGELLGAPNVERLNVGPYATSQVSWDQPHEGNLFHHLYQQRALQTPQLGAAAETAAPAL